MFVDKFEFLISSSRREKTRIMDYGAGKKIAWWEINLGRGKDGRDREFYLAVYFLLAGKGNHPILKMMA